MRFLLNSCFIATVALIDPAVAQDAIEVEAPIPAIEATAPPATIEMPPNRIGDLTVRSGKVSLRAPGQAAWTDAEVNQPVYAGAALRTDTQARAEIRVGANAIELSDTSEIEIIVLGDQFTQIALRNGRIGLHLRQVEERESVEIDTQRGGIWLLGPGNYDIDAGTGDQPLRVAVFSGSARFAGGGSDTPIASGEMAVLTGSEPVTASVEPAAPDAFVEWCRTRDYDEARLAAPYYISSYMTGFGELDGAGSWEITAQYGRVWVPSEMAEDWAPYRYGHWSWMEPWGWTWIDDQSWGFAPSHYGRWAMIDGHWAWVPGSFVEHPGYAPAVVAFLGTPGVGLSSEDGAAVGWFPLAPGEAYWPSYTRDLSYVRNLNVGNVQDVETIRMRADGEPPLEVFDQDFANRQFATVVPRAVFANGRPVSPARLALPVQRLQNAPVLMGSPQIAPASAQQVARAATTTTNPSSSRTLIRISRKAGVKSVRTVSTQAHGRGQPVVIRGAHLHAPSYAGTSRGRQVIVLRIAHVPRAGTSKGTQH
jgi:Family of unknown function (DUF6600)